ncbi:Hypothetical protein CINCED_3A010541 [Cinara cedri]|uniref:MICOS complex subunit MIC60 n=1 Tax=Cinara cedri TaxID=506608 RepID=A0A5E4MF44_9HEMI|nr:Hypothetical protein CINCED_3A010541 [Cinara cedri]
MYNLLYILYLAEPQQIISKNQNESVKNYTEKTKSKENVDNPTPEPAIVVTPPRQYTLDELETEILQKSSMAIAALKIATEAIKEYSKNMFNLIESATKKIDPNFNISLQKLEDRKNEIYTKAFEDFKKYGKEIAEKQKLLNNSKFEESPDRLAKSIHKTNEALEELTHANLSLENEYYNLDYIKKYATNVNEAQTSLIKEFESLFPDSDLTQHKINIKNNDFDIFLLYSLKKLNYYQDKLSKQEGILDRKINNAMNTEFLNIETINEINSRLNSEIYKLEEQFNKQLNEFDVKVGEDLQVQLKANAQAHADLVAKAVDFTKEEFENQVHEELSALEKLEHQKYQAQLDLLKSELQSVVNNLKEQATNEKKIFTNQAIWEAGEFLKSSLASSDNEEPIDIKNQINAINKLGASDSVVKQVVSAVPSKALENGVYSKGQLKEDFNQVEKRVYQTALIPDDSFSLPLMVFSYFTSLFVIRHSHISPSEVNNEEFDPLELNTYEIIERARYCIDRDDILQALKYLNLLSGCSRVVAKEWMKKATVFLETKQAIDLLISYTTVISYSAAHTI